MKKILMLAAMLILAVPVVAADSEGNVNVLFFGHSFGQDSINYVPELASSAGIGNLRICLFLVGNCSLENHYNKLQGGEGPYTCKVSEPGTTVYKTSSMLSSEAIRKYKWDYVVLQTSLENEGRYETVQPWLDKMIAAITEAQKDEFDSTPEFCWNLFWPISTLLENKPSNEKAFYRLSFYEQSSAKAWEAYKKTAERILKETSVTRIIPTGQAVMDLRASSFNTEDKKQFTRDGYHMSYNYGRYIAACAFYESLIAPVFRKKVIKNKFVPKLDKYPLPAGDAKLIRNSVAVSVANSK